MGISPFTYKKIAHRSRGERCRGDSFIYLDTAPAPAFSSEHVRIRSRDDPGYITSMAVHEVRIRISGEGYVNITSVPVNPDSTFSFTIGNTVTAGLPAGTYRIYLEYPPYRDLSGIAVREETGRVMNREGDLLFLFAGIRDRQMSGYAAAELFERELNRPDAGNRYDRVLLTVAGI